MAGLTTDQIVELKNFKEVFNALLLAAGSSPEAKIRRVAVVDYNGSLRSIKGTVGDEVLDANRRKLGDKVTYVIAPVTSTLKDWAYGSPRNMTSQRTTFVPVARRRQATDLTTVYKTGDAGLIAMVENLAENTLDSTMAWLDNMLAEFALTNPLLPDGTGKRFYDTGHPVDPLNLGLGVQDNVTTTAANLTEDEVIAALAVLAQLRWLNNIPFIQNNMKAVAMTGNYKLFTLLQKFQRGTMVGKQMNAVSAAPESNIIEITKAIDDVVWIPKLGDTSIDPNAMKYIYYMLAPTENTPAFIACPSEDPRLEITGLNDGDTLSVEHGAVGYGVVAFGGVSGALYQCTVRQTVTTV